MRSSHFKPLKTSYAIVFSLPLVVGFRGLGNLKNLLRNTDTTKHSEMTSYVKVPAFVNSLFSQILFAESKLLKHLNYPFGTTVMIVAEKPKGR